MVEIGTHSAIERADVVTLDLKVRATHFYPNQRHNTEQSGQRGNLQRDLPAFAGGVEAAAAGGEICRLPATPLANRGANRNFQKPVSRPSVEGKRIQTPRAGGGLGRADA